MDLMMLTNLRDGPSSGDSKNKLINDKVIKINCLA